MVFVFELALCALATFGLYALLARLAVSLLRRERCCLAIRGDGKTAEEVAALAAIATLRIECDKNLSEGTVVLLDGDQPTLEKALLAEGFLVYKRI